MKRAICYFTGTGNSLLAGQVIDKTIGGCDFFPIPQVMKAPEILNNYEELGIVFPVYSFTAPEIVLDFCDCISSKFINRYVFALATCGAVSGDTLPDLYSRLERNGITLAYCRSVVMPDNFTAFLPAPSDKMAEKTLDKAENKLRGYAHEIGVGVKTPAPKGAFGLTAPIGKLFMSDGLARDEKFILTRSCDGCGACVGHCPVGNIEMENGKPKFLHHCSFCLGCFNRCPKGAINYGRSTIKKKRYVNPRIF